MRKVLLVLVSVVLFLLAGGIFYLLWRVQTIESGLEEVQGIERVVIQGRDGDSRELLVPDYTGEIASLREYVDSAIATVSSEPTEPVTTQTVVERTVTESKKQTSFVSMGGTSTTTSTDWVDVPASSVTFDLANDFSADANVTWEASLKVAHGNGTAYARIWDDTNKITVSGSELSTANNVDYMTVSSGSLPIWSGNNTYKVQIKSLNSFEITYSGGKMKIVY